MPLKQTQDLPSLMFSSSSSISSLEYPEYLTSFQNEIHSSKSIFPSRSVSIYSKSCDVLSLAKLLFLIISPVAEGLLGIQKVRVVEVHRSERLNNQIVEVIGQTPWMLVSHCKLISGRLNIILKKEKAFLNE